MLLEIFSLLYVTTITMLTNAKRLGRYHNVPCNNSNNDKSSSQSYFNKLASLYKDNSKGRSFYWNKPLFGKKRPSLQKVLENANKTIEKSTKFINKIKSKQLACADRAKSIPENATITKEYIKCGKRICQQELGRPCSTGYTRPENDESGKCFKK
jgi:hypothetical protein